MTRLPVLFLSHGGGPCFFMEPDSANKFSAGMNKHSKAAQFYREIPALLPMQEIKSILVVSAHWEETDFTVGYQENGTSLVYDYYGFPEYTYAPHLVYPAPTDLPLADHVAELVRGSGMKCGKENRGFDHGVFIPLKLAFPDATIPVVQLSLRSSLDTESHLALGEALTPLRDEGVLIVCSGQITHNLRTIGVTTAESTESLKSFQSWVSNLLENTTDTTRPQSRLHLRNILKEAPDATTHHPRTEHLLPLHVAFGAGFGATNTCSSATCRRIYSDVILGSMAIDSYIFN